MKARHWVNTYLIEDEMRDSLDALRNSVFEDGITKLKAAMSQKDDRKNKLEHLELEEFRSLIDETLTDWKNSNQDEILARQIARTAYGFNKNRDLPYSEWIKKFEDYTVVIKEIKKLENYKNE